MRTLTEKEKQQIAAVIGKDLVAIHGKKKYYTQPQIKRALERNAYLVDVHCWAYCLFLSHDAFDTYHASIGEICDFISMKTSMLASATDHVSDSWLDFDWDLSWLELPDFDLTSIFDIFD